LKKQNEKNNFRKILGFFIFPIIVIVLNYIFCCFRLRITSWLGHYAFSCWGSISSYILSNFEFDAAKMEDWRYMEQTKIVFVVSLVTLTAPSGVF